MKSGSMIASALVAGVSLAMGAATMPSGATVGEKAPSEDAVLRDFHSLGVVDGRSNIFRCASPLHDLEILASTTRPDDLQFALARMQRIYGMGIRTIICLEDPDRPEGDDGQTDSTKAAALKRRVALERMAAAQADIRWVLIPMANRGRHSLQDMSDAQVYDWLTHVSDEVLTDARSGGVMFHCSGGHDRTGIVAAFIRIKYEGWSVDQAIDEMRRYGHNWPKFSSNGGVSSWHEDHLRAIAKMLTDAPTTRP
jgi:hypothetical protein